MEGREEAMEGGGGEESVDEDIDSNATGVGKGEGLGGVFYEGV